MATSDSEESNLEAKAALMNAKNVLPDKIPVLKAFVIANSRLGNKDEAKEYLKEIVSMNIPDNDRCWAQDMLLNIDHQ